ncbi:sterol desaturase family protein [Tahibacter amnicola]|uniref:Sterol desaturase family protein n=1 Tax=Tahibacter amnicola TaxID=2976241 RepID=A0ABY6B9L8_9GAMM|nr:sterol desaturase family protein [Tahibacter amnicola]UXI65818.1 sterol desaturase family protein [Tahibacter amnicola]
MRISPPNWTAICTDMLDERLPHDTDAFRARYRAGISRWYNPWLHGGFVLLFGSAVMAWLLGRIDGLNGWEWLALPTGLIIFSWGEYTVHRTFGHHKYRIGALFYKRHTGDHHSFFVDAKMPYGEARDWRVILFPAWLIVLFSGALVPAYWLLAKFNGDAAALFCATLLGGYLTYEVFHACEHLPPQHPLARLPWIRHMRRLHQLHHRRDLMQSYNFNLVFPLMDWLRGTLYWEPETPPTR